MAQTSATVPSPRVGPSYRQDRSHDSEAAGLAYVVIGIVVAATHHYFAHVGGLKGVASAVLAVILWPLLLIGVNLHIH